MKKYIIKDFNSEEAILYPWRVIGTGFVPEKIEDDGDDIYPIEIYSEYGSLSYTKSGLDRIDQKHPVIFLLDIKAMQENGYEIPDFVLEKEPDLNNKSKNKEQNAVQALIDYKEQETDPYRKEMAWDILMSMISSPKFDGDKNVVDKAFQFADEFIKQYKSK